MMLSFLIQKVEKAGLKFWTVQQLTTRNSEISREIRKQMIHTCWFCEKEFGFGYLVFLVPMVFLHAKRKLWTNLSLSKEQLMNQAALKMERQQAFIANTEIKYRNNLISYTVRPLPGADTVSSTVGLGLAEAQLPVFG